MWGAVHKPTSEAVSGPLVQCPIGYKDSGGAQDLGHRAARRRDAPSRFPRAAAGGAREAGGMAVMEEMRILQSLDSRFVVELKMAFTQAGCMYMALEYMTGGRINLAPPS